MNANIFSKCKSVNDHLRSGNETTARDELIKVLAHCEKEHIPYDPLINHLIRETGLYPYMKLENAGWQDRYLFEAFKVDIGGDVPATLHRDQSALLRSLLDGQNLAISAPTSFGKSFVIDSFIAIKRPLNVVIIVPTIALADETRRRLHRKFSDAYKIITTADVQLGEKNILIFPQERAIGYVDKLPALDILIIDEFYKASKKFDKERAPSLIKAIMQLSEKAAQRYFLAPNISELKKKACLRKGCSSEGSISTQCFWKRTNFTGKFRTKSKRVKHCSKFWLKQTIKRLSTLAPIPTFQRYRTSS